MRLTAVVVLMLLLAGCKEFSEEFHFQSIPAELKDCRFYAMQNSGGRYLTMARCPNSTTSVTTTSGKSAVTTVVIDGEEYERKDQ